MRRLASLTLLALLGSTCAREPGVLVKTLGRKRTAGGKEVIVSARVNRRQLIPSAISARIEFRGDLDEFRTSADGIACFIRVADVTHRRLFTSIEEDVSYHVAIPRSECDATACRRVVWATKLVDTDGAALPLWAGKFNLTVLCRLQDQPYNSVDANFEGIVVEGNVENPR